MKQAQLNLLIAFFSYAGNGGVSMVHHRLVGWFAKVYHELMQDQRIGNLAVVYPGDVPLTMERNRVVKTAKEQGFDVVWMLDNDNLPDLYVGADPSAQPFFASSFDFLYQRAINGLPTVVCSPYCGPPPHPVRGGEENVYAFFWETRSDNLEDGMSIKPYSRQQAAQMRGIQPIAAGPTGCALYTLSAFDLMPIRQQTQAEILEQYARGELDTDRTLRLLNMDSWYFYEYTDQYRTTKASTEDVTNTREIAMAGWLRHQQDVVFCNWDSWAGHAKPKIVGKPNPIYLENVSGQYTEAVLDGVSAQEEVRDVNFEVPEQRVEDAAETEQKFNQPPESLTTGNGRVQITKRMVAGRAVQSVGHVTPLADLEALTAMVEWIAQHKPDTPLTVIEIGSWVGESAIALQAGFKQAGGYVYCVDHFRGNKDDHLGQVADALGGAEGVFNHFLQNVGELIDTRIRVIAEPSVQAAARLTPPQEADLIFIDGSHQYEDVKADILAWLPHTGQGGWIVGHDFNLAFPGVQQAVKEMFIDAGCEVRLPEGTTLWAVSVDEYRARLEQQHAAS